MGGNIRKLHGSRRSIRPSGIQGSFDDKIHDRGRILRRKGIMAVAFVKDDFNLAA
jgi:hypothetical protein